MTVGACEIPEYGSEDGKISKLVEGFMCGVVMLKETGSAKVERCWLSKGSRLVEIV